MQIQLNPTEALTLEFRATGGRRSLTLGRPWNNLLERWRLERYRPAKGAKGI
jgi:hypothetical protein